MGETLTEIAPVTVDPCKGSVGGLSVESIPVVDLRFLTQSELTSLSRCSLHAVHPTRREDLKINRSEINKSAGSRKQTYVRFRFARRKPGLSAKPPPLPARVEDDDPARLHNSEMTALFKKLFNADEDDSQISPLTMECSTTLAETTTKRKRGARKTTQI